MQAGKRRFLEGPGARLRDEPRPLGHEGCSRVISPTVTPLYRRRWARRVRARGQRSDASIRCQAWESVNDAPPVTLMARAPGEDMDVRRLLSSMAIEVHDLTPNEVFERIAEYACVAVDASGSGIMLTKGRRSYQSKGTSDDVDKAHALQMECNEGPCLDAIRGGDAVYVTGDAPHDERWPTWGARVAELGFRSVVSVRLETPGRKYGSLNAYSSSLNDFTPSDVEVMQYLAAHASAAIAASHNVEHLNVALESRSQIGQAQGILMLAYDLEPEGAFQYLRRLSQHNNTRLADVAQQVIAQRRELPRT
jgi:hypothetical protein